jgi:hypothetical protein
MHRMKIQRHAAAALVALAGAGLAGCGNTATNTVNEVIMDGPPEGLVVGAPTTVGFRADALGAARDLPVSVGTDSINGAVVTLSGTLHRASSDWIVLDDSVTNQRHWVRIESLNWVRQHRPAPTSPQSEEHPDAGHSDDTHGG